MGHDLNIRNAGKDLITALKSEAALAGKTLRDYCLGILHARAINQRVALPDGTTAPYYWPATDPRVTAGLERHDPVTVTVCGADLSKPEVAQAVTDVAEAAIAALKVETLKAASELPKPNTHRCPRCDSKLVPWGTKVWRCIKCARNYTESEMAR